MTKEEIWEKLETEFKLRGYSKKSISTYKAGITTFLDWANKPYEDLDEEDFRNYLIQIIQEGKLKPQTINSKNSAIRFFLVVILGKDVNPMRTARLRGVLNLPNVWSKETVERFFSVIDNPRDLAILMNIYGSGLRVSEICRLKVEDIDSKRMRIFVLQGKFNRDRYTILSQRGLEALRRYWRTRHCSYSEALFCHACIGSRRRCTLSEAPYGACVFRFHRQISSYCRNKHSPHQEPSGRYESVNGGIACLKFKMYFAIMVMNTKRITQ